MSRYDGLDGRVALVTGAARGLGAAVSRSLLSQGCRVGMVDIDAAGLERVRHELGGSDSQVLVALADLADVKACAAAVERAEAEFGRLDILVNNAAVLRPQLLEQVTPAQFDATIAVNLRAPFFLAQAAFPIMVKGGYGRVINVSSVAVRTGGSLDCYPYVASKGGLVALTKALAQRGARDGILVNSVLPAALDTPMLAESFGAGTLEAIKARIPLGRLADPQETAEFIVWLASPASSFVTGASFDVNGGWVMS
jgi:NAD(P)-dependent dehydrogenase (short-subunit alcohol dehydrogenase family)